MSCAKAKLERALSLFHQACDEGSAEITNLEALQRMGFSKDQAKSAACGVGTDAFHYRLPVGMTVLHRCDPWTQDELDAAKRAYVSKRSWTELARAAPGRIGYTIDRKLKSEACAGKFDAYEFKTLKRTEAAAPISPALSPPPALPPQPALPAQPPTPLVLPPPPPSAPPPQAGDAQYEVLVAPTSAGRDARFLRRAAAAAARQVRDELRCVGGLPIRVRYTHGMQLAPLPQNCQVDYTGLFSRLDMYPSITPDAKAHAHIQWRELPNVPRPPTGPRRCNVDMDERIKTWHSTRTWHAHTLAFLDALRACGLRFRVVACDQTLTKDKRDRPDLAVVVEEMLLLLLEFDESQKHENVVVRLARFIALFALPCLVVRMYTGVIPDSIKKLVASKLDDKSVFVEDHEYELTQEGWRRNYAIMCVLRTVLLDWMPTVKWRPDHCLCSMLYFKEDFHASAAAAAAAEAQDDPPQKQAELDDLPQKRLKHDEPSRFVRDLHAYLDKGDLVLPNGTRLFGPEPEEVDAESLIQGFMMWVHCNDDRKSSAKDAEFKFDFTGTEITQTYFTQTMKRIFGEEAFVPVRQRKSIKTGGAIVLRQGFVFK